MSLRLDVVGIVVSDMARSLAFHRQLGFDLPASLDAEPHVEARLGGSVRIAWDPVETIHSFDQAWTAPSGGSRMSVAFDCGNPAEVDATYSRLVAAGYEGHLPPWDAVWGMRYAIVHDPDGNSIDLFASLQAVSGEAG